VVYFCVFQAVESKRVRKQIYTIELA